MNTHAARKSRSKLLPAAITSVIVVAVLGVAVWLLRDLLAKKPDGPKREVPLVVHVIRPPPDLPPPPPPPPEEKLEEPLPKDTPDQPPDDSPQQQLGIDADASAGSDGFGLAARKGGADLVGTGNAMFAWYTSLLKDTISDKLSDDERVRKGNYSVIVRLWLASDGRINRVALAQSTGNRQLDGDIERALNSVGRVREAPPIEMPQPVTLKIISRS
jgi:protein TonB